MNDNSTIIRKVLIGFLVFVVLVWGLIWLAHYLSTGSLTVTTTNITDTVSVRPLDSPLGSAQTKSAPHSLTARLKPGQYVISAASHSLSSSRVVSVRARQSAAYHMDPAKAATIEPVLPASVSDLAAGPSGMTYVDALTSNLMHMGLSGAPFRLAAFNVRQSSLPAPDSGVVQDKSGRLFLLNGVSVSPLDTGGHTPDKRQSNICLSKDGLLAFTSQGKVYSGRLGAGYAAVLPLEDQAAKVYCAGGKVAVVEKIDTEGQAEGIDRVTIINGSSRVTREIPALGVSWSPSGKYLFIASEEDNRIYDSSLRLVARLDSTPFGAFTWMDEQRLAYATGRLFWVYDVAGQSASQIAQSDSDIGLLAGSTDGSRAYLATVGDGGGSGGAIQRVGLRGQSVPGKLGILNVFLPEDIGVCHLSYVNFGAPAITMTYPADSTPAQLCINAAKGQLAYYGVPSGRFQYIAAPVSQSD